MSTATAYFDHLSSLDEDDLRGLEVDRAALNAHFTAWRRDTGRRGGLIDVLSRLTAGELVYRNDAYNVFETRPGRISERRAEMGAAEQPLGNADSNTSAVEISEHIMVGREEGVPLVVGAGESIEEQVHIVNRSALPLTLLRVKVNQTHADTFTLLQNERITIQPNITVSLSLSFSPLEVGMHRLALRFQFDGFYIDRYANVQCGDVDIGRLLQPSAAYERPRVSRTYASSCRIYRGRRQPSNSTPFVNKLAKYFIPLELRKTLRTGELDEYLRRVKEIFDSNPSQASYGKLYQHLLWAEELTAEHEMRMYNIDSTELHVHGKYLRLDVPGLSEKRPSLLRGDAVLASYCTRNGHDNDAFEGIVHDVQQSSVLLAFNSKFHDIHTNGTNYKIEFQLSRTPMRLLHQALNLLSVRQWQDFMFPQTNAQTGEIGTFHNLRYFNRNLNEEQKRAVKYITAGRGEEAPYVIFGPPGTGKTSTAVEAIKQMHKLHPNSRILVTAPSNAAVDVLMTRLLTSFNPSELFRFVAYNCSDTSVSPQTLPYCKKDSDGCFTWPEMEVFRSYRVVVCTCTMAAKLHNYGIEKEYFHTVFIDECGHCWEPESVASIAGTMRQGGQLIISGDPMQLGPITRSNVAARHGLDTSMIERLINHPLYTRNINANPDTNGFDPFYITELIHCYRCHPDIIKIPNELFYNNDLIASADLLVSHNLAQWTGLPRAGFPLIFHGVEGENIREANSPSWFNVSEVEKVLEYILRLKDTARVPLTDIGVITPYHKQTVKIKKALQSRHLEGVTVGSCEQFQGQERRVIIISTVRSMSGDFVADKQYSLGFVANPKRFNVAITRAQALLIVIGSPVVLSMDNNWKRFMEHCASSGGAVGADIPIRGDDVDDLGGMVDGMRIDEDDFEIIDQHDDF